MPDTRVPQVPSAQIAQLEAAIHRVPQQDRSPYILQTKYGIQIPAGYRLDEKSGKLNYVALSTDQYSGITNVLRPEIALPAVIGGGFGLGSLLGGGAGAAASGAGAAAIPSDVAGTTLGATGGLVPGLSSAGDAGAAGATGAAAAGAGGGLGSRLLNTAITGLAGLPGLLGNNGPSDQEKALTSQIQQLLQQQQQRTQYQNPLYEAVTQMAYGLLPKRQGGYPGSM